MAKFGNKPGSVLVDMSLIEKAPDKNLPFLIITGPRGQNCNKQGIPSKEEIDKLEEILSATDDFLTGVTAKTLAGTFTYNCERLNYYYVKDTLAVRSAITRLYNRSYKNYDYVLKIKHDPEWSSYRTFLYPDEETRNWMENEKIIAGMLERGDSLKNPRELRFDLYFKTDTARNAFEKFANGKGYTTDTISTARNKVVPYEIILSRTSDVQLNTINTLTYELRKEAEKHGGFYNGWQIKKTKTLK
jgi:hypothetical protein